MAKSTTSALVNEIKAAGHEKTAAKLAVLESLSSVPQPGEHRELTDDEVKTAAENALSVHQHKAAQAVEYGTWTAREDIFHGAALAYAAGQPVPVSNVETYGYDELGLVERVADRSAPEAKTQKTIVTGKTA
jgi:hypothetical protein